MFCEICWNLFEKFIEVIFPLNRYFWREILIQSTVKNALFKRMGWAVRADRKRRLINDEIDHKSEKLVRPGHEKDWRPITDYDT